jgi:hypothetical protein
LIVVLGANVSEIGGCLSLKVVASPDMERNRIDSLNLSVPFRLSIRIGPPESQIAPSLERFREACLLEKTDLPRSQDVASPNLGKQNSESALRSEDIFVGKLKNIRDRTRS